MSSSTHHTHSAASSQPPAHVPTEIYGPKDTKPSIVLRPRIRRFFKDNPNSSGHVTTTLPQAAGEPSELHRIDSLATLIRKQASTRKQELLNRSHSETETGAVWSKVVSDTLAPYCKETKQKIVVCYSLPGFARIVADNPQWDIERGPGRDQLAQYLSDTPTAPEPCSAEDDTALKPSLAEDNNHLYRVVDRGRPRDGNRKEGYTASEPGCDEDDDRGENDDPEEAEEGAEDNKTTRSSELRGRPWDSD